MMIKITVIGFVFGLLFLLPLGVNADPPGMPGGHGNSGDQSPAGGGAPIGSGIALLVGLSAAYGSRKVFQLNQNKE